MLERHTICPPSKFRRQIMTQRRIFGLWGVSCTKSRPWDLPFKQRITWLWPTRLSRRRSVEFRCDTRKIWIPWLVICSKKIRKEDPPSKIYSIIRLFNCERKSVKWEKITRRWNEEKKRFGSRSTSWGTVRSSLTKSKTSWRRENRSRLNWRKNCGKHSKWPNKIGIYSPDRSNKMRQKSTKVTHQIQMPP